MLKINQLQYFCDLKQTISQNMFHQRKTPFRNRRECSFLKQNKRHLYHPAKQRYPSKSSYINSCETQRRLLNSIVSNSNSHDLRYNEQTLTQRRQEQRQAQGQSQLQLQVLLQRQLAMDRYIQSLRLQRQRQQQYQQNIHFLRQIYYLSGSYFSSLNFLKNDKQEFLWFFQKNKIFNLIQNNSPELQKFNQCPICFEDFLEQIKLQRQKIECKNKFEAQQQKEQQCCSLLLLEKDQQSQKIEQPKQVLLIELYCGHIYHKDCVQKWLKQNPNCAVCRKDFRDHQQYSKWDEDYKKRFSYTEQKKLQRSTSAFYSPTNQNQLSLFSIFDNLSSQIQFASQQMQNSNIQQIEVQEYEVGNYYSSDQYQ